MLYIIYINIQYQKQYLISNSISEAIFDKQFTQYLIMINNSITEAIFNYDKQLNN